MGAVAEQHRRDPGPAPGEPGPGVQGVTAVVAATDEQDDPGAVHPPLPEQGAAGGGEPGGGPLHEGTVGKALHEYGLGGPDGLDAISDTHASSLPRPLHPRARRAPACARA